MKHVWKMLTAAVLCLALLLPLAGVAEEAVDRVWGLCTADDVRLRKQASTEASKWFNMDTGFVAEILDEIRNEDGSVAWYEVSAKNPEENDALCIGYVYGAYFRPLTEAETEAYLKEQGLLPSDPAEEEDEPTVKPSIDDVFGGSGSTAYEGIEVSGVTATTLGGANFRSEPSTSTGKILMTIPGNTQVNVLAIPLADAKEPWYRVYFDGTAGYIHGGMIEIDEESTTPAPGFGTEVKDTTGSITADGVNFRAEPNTNAQIYAKLDEGIVVEILTVPDAIGAKYWYRVRYDGQVGYVQSNYIRLKKTEATPTVTPENDTVTGPATGLITADGVNLRVGPGTKYDSLGKLNTNTVVELLTIPSVIDSEHWYRVRYNGSSGYVQAPYIRILTANESDLPDAGEYGYARLKKDYAWLRDKPAGSYMVKWSGRGSLMRLVGEPSKASGYNWYPVFNDKNSTIYYVRGDQIEIMYADETVPTPTPLPESDYGYVVTTGNDVNLRLQPGGEIITQVPIDTILPCVGEPSLPKDNGTSYTWYFVRYEGMSGYLRGDYVQVCNSTGGAITPTATPDAAPTDSVTVVGYIKLIKNDVNLRKAPLKDSLVQLPLGLILPIVGEIVPAGESGKYCWYPVRTADGLKGYIRGDCAQECDSEGDKVTPAPTPTSTPDTVIAPAGTVGKLTAVTNLRAEKNTSSKILAVMKVGTLVDVLTIPADTKNGWYAVVYEETVGYVHASLLKLVEGSVVTPTPTATPTPTPTATPDAFEAPAGTIGKLTAETNLRAEKSTSSKILAVMKSGTLVDVLTIPADVKNGWYRVVCDETVGYVHASLLKLVVVEAATPTPTATATPVPEDAPAGTLGKLTAVTNLRAEKSTSSKILAVMKAGTVLDVLSIPTDTKNGWYRVSYEGEIGYVHASLLKVLEDVATPTPTVEPSSPLDAIDSAYLRVTHNSVNLRESYSQESDRLYTVNANTVMPYLGYKKTGTVTWYCAFYKDDVVWVHGSYAEVMSMTEYNEWTGKDFDTTANRGYLKLTSNNVFVRNAAAGDVIVDQLPINTIVRYYSDAITAGDYDWYLIYTPNGNLGYIREDMVEACNESGGPLPTPTPNLGNTFSAPDSQQETSYSRLKLGSTGAAVTNLVNELINQGYYKGAATSSYTSEVQSAVKAFQLVKGITVTGTADADTQHALFGTQPIGSGDTTNLDFAIYPVEKIDWFDGGIQQMIPRGANFKIYDVKTGIVWWAHRWAGGSHADIETLTAADSARLCQIYGVKDLQQIVDDNMWERRPCLVTIGTRTFACSLDGMQHNPDGDTIANNGMNGQICLHFTNSKGHASGSVSTSHKEAIEYAYNNCPAGQKK